MKGESMMETIDRILKVLRLAERLKFELRHSWLSNGRRESVAEHTWQMALMVVLMQHHLERSVDVERTLKMVIIHDLVEAEAGDVPFFETGERQTMKAANERAAIEKIRNLLDGATAQEVYELWYEFEGGETLEAKFAKAVDNLEVQIQHNQAAFETWEEIEQDLVYTKMDKHCQHDAFLRAFCVAVKTEAEDKMRQAGVAVEAVRQRTGEIE